MEILPGIYCLPIKTRTLPPHQTTNCYIIKEEDRALVIDAIDSEKGKIQKYLLEIGVKSIQTAVITHSHRDHYNGLKSLLKIFGGKVFCHPDAMPRLTHVFQEDSMVMTLKNMEIM